MHNQWTQYGEGRDRVWGGRGRGAKRGEKEQKTQLYIMMILIYVRMPA